MQIKIQKRIECIVTGKVQMVSFRDYAVKKAKSLKLTGTVENQRDRSVVVIAEGETKNLETFIGFLEKGPTFADVRDVQVEWLPRKGEFSEFIIL